MNGTLRTGSDSTTSRQDSGTTPGSRITALAALGQQIWLDKLLRAVA